MRKFLQNWWNGLRYEPGDPRYLTGSDIKIAAIGGGTGLATLLRGLKHYSNSISAIVTVADSGSSTGKLRKEFDMVAPGDIRKCIAALAEDEDLITGLFEYRFKDGNDFSGHTLGNIWLTALAQYSGSFDKAIEITTEIFKTSGKVLPSTLENVDLKIEYEGGEELIGEDNLDEVVKKIEKISLNKSEVKAYKESVEALSKADLIIIGPGSLYGSIIPNLLIPEIVDALHANSRAIKVYIANCSTERTQTAHFSVEDHIAELQHYAGKNSFDYCLVNDNIIRLSDDVLKLGEINNITTENNVVGDVKVVRGDIISEENPLYHDSEKLASVLMDFYSETKRSRAHLPREMVMESN